LGLPPAPTSLLAEARAAADRGELARALALALAAEEQLPLSPLPACLRGLVRVAQGDEEGAVAEFRRALGCEEGFVAAQLSLGQALVRLGREDEARRWLLRALVQLESMPPQAEVAGLDVPAEVARRLAHEALLREEHA
jgi:tetratricopeptide (TPR) repeat protein